MMRPVTVNVDWATPLAPTMLPFTRGSVILNWIDEHAGHHDRSDHVGQHGAGVGGTLQTQEIGFRIERSESIGGPFTRDRHNVPANTTTYTDLTADPNHDVLLPDHCLERRCSVIRPRPLVETGPRSGCLDDCRRRHSQPVDGRGERDIHCHGHPDDGWKQPELSRSSRARRASARSRSWVAAPPASPSPPSVSAPHTITANYSGDGVLCPQHRHDGSDGRQGHDDDSRHGLEPVVLRSAGHVHRDRLARPGP